MNKLSGNLYRLFTEDINRKEVIKLAASQFEGFTLKTDSIGYWHGQPEKSLSIEVITEDGAAVEKLAELIKEVNHQEAVLIERIKNEAYLA